MKENAGGFILVLFFLSSLVHRPFGRRPTSRIYVYLSYVCNMYTRAMCVYVCVWGESIAVEVPSVVYCRRRRTCA